MVPSLPCVTYLCKHCRYFLLDIFLIDIVLLCRVNSLPIPTDHTREQIKLLENLFEIGKRIFHHHLRWQAVPKQNNYSGRKKYLDQLHLNNLREGQLHIPN